MFTKSKLHKLFTIIILGVVFLSCNTPADSPYPSIVFHSVTPIPVGRASAVCFVINDRAYITLGRSDNQQQLSDCWEFEPIAEKWTQMASYPDTTRVKAMAAVVNGKAYVGLGYDNSQGSNGMTYIQGLLHGMRMFDPASNTWSAPLAIFPSRAVNACVSFVHGEDIYVGAGFDGKSFTSEFWKYSTLDDKWTRLNDFPGNVRSDAVVCSDNLHFYFGTGWNTRNITNFSTWNQHDWWEYFPNTDTWKQLKSMADKGRTNAVALSIDNRYFVATGRYYKGSLTGGKILSDISEYDANKNIWYLRGSIPSGNRENAVAFTINGKGYIGLGEDGLDINSTILNDFWSFGP